MSERKKFEAWANKILAKYEKVLLLQDHLVSLRYADVDEGSLMEHGFMYPYKTTDIRYNRLALEHFRDKKYSELKACLIHELCHSITDPFYNVAYDRFVSKDTVRNERERLTDHIANIIVKAGI